MDPWESDDDNYDDYMDFMYTPMGPSDDDDTCPPSFSPITTDEDSEFDSDCSSDMAIGDGPIVISRCDVNTLQDQTPDKGMELECSRQSFSFKIVGDNVDKNVTPRYNRVGHRVTSLHYYHSFAIQDRINVNSLASVNVPSCLPHPSTRASLLLPSITDDNELSNNIKILISRILIKTLPSPSKCLLNPVM